MRWGARFSTVLAMQATLVGCAERAPSDRPRDGAKTLGVARQAPAAAFDVLTDFELEAPLYGPAPGSQLWPVVSTDGNGFLTVWSDDRHGGYSLFGTRIGSDGAVLDRGGLPVEYGAGPGMAYNGQHNLLVWTTSDGMALRSRRVSASGAPLDADSNVVAAPGSPVSHRVASNGQDFLVVWTGSTFGSAGEPLYATRVAADGSVLDTTGVQLLESGPLNGFDLAWNGNSYVVAWSYGEDIYARRIDANGVLLDPAPILVCNAPDTQSRPDVERVGANVWIAWTDLRGTADVYAARIDAGGALLDPQGVIVTPGSSHASAPHLIATGDSAVITWHDGAGGGPFGQRMAASLDADLRPVSGPYAIGEAVSPSHGTFDGNHILVTWTDPDYDVVGRRLTTSGEPVEPAPFPVATAANIQFVPSVEWGSGGYLVAWADIRSDENAPASGLYTALVNDDGRVLTDPALRVANTLYPPQVAAAGQQYAVAWHEYVDAVPGDPSELALNMVRIDAQGRALDTMPIEVTDPIGLGPWTVAGGDDSYLFLWMEWATEAVTRSVRLTTDGTRLDPVPITVTTTPLDPPVAVWNGEAYFVVWYGAGPLGLQAAWIERDGAVRRADLSFPLSSEELIDVAWNGSGYLLLFHDPYSSPAGPAVLALDADGRAQGPIRKIQGPIEGRPFSREALAWDGVSYLVTWSGYDGNDPPSDALFLARVGGRAELLDSTPTMVPLERPLIDGESLALASAQRGKSLLVYSQHVRPYLYRDPTRLRARQIVEPIPADAGADAPAADTGADATVIDTGTDVVVIDTGPDVNTDASTDADVDASVADATPVDDAAHDVIPDNAATDAFAPDGGTRDGATLDASQSRPDGGTDKVVLAAADDGSCDCRLTSRSPSRVPGFLVVAGAVLGWWRRRKRTITAFAPLDFRLGGEQDPDAGRTLGRSLNAGADPRDLGGFSQANHRQGAQQLGAGVRSR